MLGPLLDALAAMVRGRRACGATLRTAMAWSLLGLATATLAGCWDGNGSNGPAAPVFTQQPGDVTVNEGAATTFNVAVSPPTATVQWYRNGTAIGGATSASYTTPATTAADNGATFFAIAQTAPGVSATSNTATLTVRPRAPAITTQPASTTVNAGASATFSVVASGTGLAYQWQRGTTNIAGATAASYTLSGATAGDDGATFRVVVTNASGSVTSNAATLTVISPPAITTQPANAGVTAGSPATFSVVATGTGLAYQWQRGTTNIAGATAASYTIPATVSGDDGASFRVVVTNAAGSVTSNAATLTVTSVSPPSTFRTTPMVVGHGTGGIALKADGTVWAWGGNSDGQAGQGTTGVAVTSPVQVKTANGPLTRIRKVAAAFQYVLALDDDGNVWTWGRMDRYMATAQPDGGSQSFVARKVYASATGGFLSNVVDIAAGGLANAALLSDGTVVAWGRNAYGALGNGTFTGEALYPTPVPGLTGIVGISGGFERFFARTGLGAVYAWGNGEMYGLGLPGSSIPPSPVATPTQIPGLAPVADVSAASYSIAILSDGQAAFWGESTYDGTTATDVDCIKATYRSPPIVVPKPAGTASTFSSAVAMNRTQLVVFGGAVYQTGDPIDDVATGPCAKGLVQVAGLSNVVGVSQTWGNFTHAWTADGRVFGLGDNSFGNLGVGNTVSVNGPRELVGFNLLGAAPSGTTVLSVDFESPLPAAIAPGDATVTSVQGYAGLGATGNQFTGGMLRSRTGNVVTVTVTNLAPHSSVNLAFLFAAIDSLDGAGSFPAGDYFKITLDGRTIFREAFANATSTQVQTYLPPPGVELARRVDLGFAGPGSFYTDSAYDMGKDPQFVLIPHTASTLTVTFEIEGGGIQDLNDESWGIDNLRIGVNP